MPNKTVMKAVLYTLAAVALINQFGGKPKDILNGDSGWF